MSQSERTPLYYTFGNHHHWVDMEWLWGYDVTPGSVQDMLRFCEATGAKGNVNFDGVGYEKIAAEDPATVDRLRQALKDGTIEIVGASYGQPYGLFHGSESNIRQRIYGVRATLRVLGFRPRTFWEEEFDFFPQLPQVLAGVGYRYASLFFQWTWHTPEVPVEEVPAVWWRAPDGSRVLTATRNRLNVHQWPEDVDIVLNELREREHPQGEVTPLMLQWLELIPTKDWMCRSEVLLPKTLELFNDPRFEFRHVTLSQYLQLAERPDTPVRDYGMDDVFHGMSLGKNGDLFRRLSRRAEGSAIAAESLATLNGLFGRPYAQWDVYPTWELEESWRELLQAQHHDNDECEGLCGHVGKFSYERSLSLSGHVLEENLKGLAARVAKPGLVVYNPTSWTCDAQVADPATGAPAVAPAVPAFGYRVYAPDELRPLGSQWTIQPDGGAIGRCGEVRVEVGPDGLIRQISNAAWPEGVLREDLPLLSMDVRDEGQRLAFEVESLEIDQTTGDLTVRFQHPKHGGVRADLRLLEGFDGVEVSLAAGQLSRPDPGIHAALQTSFAIRGDGLRLVADQPLGMQEVQAAGSHKKKYPYGDWMTSPQWFEDVVGSFTGLTFVDLLTSDGGRGLLVAHDGSQQWFRDGDTLRNTLTMYDPWDENYFVNRFQVRYRLLPHGPITNHDRWRASHGGGRECPSALAAGLEGGLPAEFAPVEVDAPNVRILSLYREMESSGRDMDAYAGVGMGYPAVLRLLETDGVETDVVVRVGATVAAAVRTNLLGEKDGDLSFGEQEVRLKLGPYQIATVMMDLVEGRKQVRDLDAHREVWATVHRLE